MSEKAQKKQLNIIFLGGVFLPTQHESIIKQSRGVLQNAADALQKAYLTGFAEHVGERIQLVNLPFIGSYPKLYDALTFPACEDTLPPNVTAHGQWFLNIRFIRFLSRFISAFRGLRHSTWALQAPIVVVYSAHLPFLAAARLIRFFRSDAFLCVIIPDLPEFMGTGGCLYEAIKKIESILFRIIVRRFDSFVLLTDAMGERIGISPKKYVVVEGIYDSSLESDAQGSSRSNDGEFVILYAGTLAARYGIIDLLQAFDELNIPNAQLWICGDGDARTNVEAMAARDPRVKYFGQVAREIVLTMNHAANLLVNPRRPVGEFTKYSFPSKTMEYLASGTPVVMHRLPGIPTEYLEYLTIPRTPDATGLAEAIREVFKLTESQRVEICTRAREFILANKSPKEQVAKVLAQWACQK